MKNPARLGHFAAQKQDGAVYMFIDNKHFDCPAYLQTEIVAMSETVEEVETEADLPAGSLIHTVAFYNQQAGGSKKSN